eukprot:49518_1
MHFAQMRLLQSCGSNGCHMRIKLHVIIQELIGHCDNKCGVFLSCWIACIIGCVSFLYYILQTTHFMLFFTGDHARHILTAVSTCHIKSTRPQREGTPGFYVGGSSILKELIAHQS